MKRAWMSVALLLAACSSDPDPDAGPAPAVALTVTRADRATCSWTADAAADTTPLPAPEPELGTCPPAVAVDRLEGAGCALVVGSEHTVQVTATGLVPRGWIQLSVDGAFGSGGDDAGAGGVLGRANEQGEFRTTLTRPTGDGVAAIEVESLQRAATRVELATARSDARIARVSLVGLRDGGVQNAIDVCTRRGPVRLRTFAGQLEGAGEDGWARQDTHPGGPCADDTEHTRFLWTVPVRELPNPAVPFEVEGGGTARMRAIQPVGRALSLVQQGEPNILWTQDDDGAHLAVRVSLGLAPGEGCTPLIAQGLPVTLDLPAGAALEADPQTDPEGRLRFGLRFVDPPEGPVTIEIISGFGALSLAVDAPPSP